MQVLTQESAMTRSDSRRELHPAESWRHLGVWFAYAAAICLAPLLFPGGGAIALLSQIGTAIVFGLSYNVLLGQGGMLSFGHAVYFGLGACAAAHGMNAAAAGSIWMPVWMAPLVGALCALLVACVLGVVTTRRAGTSFAMITFGIGELVYVMATMFPSTFGGETGISTDRMYGTPVLGASFGSALQAYYLMAIWLFLATLALYLFTLSPLGRVLNAVRDNPTRVQMLGYDPQKIRYRAMLVSAFFAGMAGALFTINFETVTSETLSAHQSGAVLLFTFIGGTTVFWGPVVGAVVGTVLAVSVAAWTPAWPLYLGLFFVLVVKFAPGGIAGIALLLWRAGRTGLLRRAAWPLALVVSSAIVSIAGLIGVIEMTYSLTLGDVASRSTALRDLLKPESSLSWMVVVALTVLSAVGFLVSRRWLLSRWVEVVDRAPDAGMGTSHE
ncbi:branched-chain amino acid ABC transporter permease [Hydrogenophaga laconesensis]|uniref:Branched-chain amino acid transport system permease protein n=1 Tax=Hydrogenophaga laconesensis TaxID=1805971 RepID=A0ABU1VIY6_9BURK|nr:branched-chain amino acid ABC transporter permease [Hydrogenophaga laconesensis]MDR7097451.1 branched-chain amino acid transport system permease protein [Hydrogenophaga laconesensis]